MLEDSVRTGMAICIPDSGLPVHKRWAYAFKSLDPPINVFCLHFSPEGMPVDQARNLSVEYCKKNKVKYLFFLDEDVIVPANVLRKFIFLFENNPSIDVISGVYCSKSDPPAPLVFKKLNGGGSYWDWKIGEFFEVEGVGMGCTMIRMSAFEKIKEPYFLTIKADSQIDGVGRSEAWTEDLYFCKKLVDAGGHIYVDGATICEHYDVHQKKFFTLPQASKPTVRRYAVGEKSILDLGCGEIATIMKDGTPVRCDLREELNPDYRVDIRCLPFKTESYDVVFSSHTLEHFSKKEIPKVLDEWLRVLKPGGELRLVIPDLEWAAKKVLDGDMSRDVMNVFYGEQSYPYDFHRMGFTRQSLKALLESKGLKIVDMHFQEPLSIVCTAIKQQARKFIGDGQGQAIQIKDVAHVLKAQKEQKRLLAREWKEKKKRQDSPHGRRSAARR